MELFVDWNGIVDGYATEVQSGVSVRIDKDLDEAERRYIITRIAEDAVDQDPVDYDEGVDRDSVRI